MADTMDATRDDGLDTVPLSAIREEDDAEEQDVLLAQEIPYDSWQSFFEEFTRRHGGDIVHVEVGSPTREGSVDTPIDTVASDIPLYGIVADLKDDAPGTLQIMLGDDVEEHDTHIIHEPTYVWLYQDEQGQDEVLEIESADGPATLIHLA